FLGDMRGNILNGNVPGHYTDPEVIADHEHQYIISSGFALKIFGMSWKLKALPLNIVFVDRCSYQCIDLTGMEILHSAFQRQKSVLTPYFVLLTQRDLHIFLPHIDHIRPFGMCLLGLVDDVKTKIINVIRFSMKGGIFCVSVYYRGKIIQHT